MEVQAEIALDKNRDLVGQRVEVLVEGSTPGAHADARANSRHKRPILTGWLY